MNELELTVTRTIRAPRRQVFEAWLTPAILARFMRPAASSEPARVTNDPVEGGRFSILMQTPEREIPHGGTYLQIDPHARLSFTWESPHSLDDSVVTIDFAALGDHETEVKIHQVKFRSQDARDGHIKGWTAILESCADVLVDA